jgi:hypothetical protein
MAAMWVCVCAGALGEVQLIVVGHRSRRSHRNRGRTRKGSRSCCPASLASRAEQAVVHSGRSTGLRRAVAKSTFHGAGGSSGRGRCKTCKRGLGQMASRVCMRALASERARELWTCNEGSMRSTQRDRQAAVWYCREYSRDSDA